MVSISRLITKRTRPCTNPFVTAPSAPITIGITITFMFQSFFNSLARSRYLSLFSLSFSFILWSVGTAKSAIRQVLFLFYFHYFLFIYLFIYLFLLTIIRSGRKCPWCNAYRRRIWARRHEFKSWTRLIAFHIALIPLGKV